MHHSFLYFAFSPLFTSLIVLLYFILPSTPNLIQSNSSNDLIHNAASLSITDSTAVRRHFHTDSSIDVVITYLNASDPIWLAQLDHYNISYDSMRFTSSNEIRYNLLALSVNAKQWLRHVFIVSEQSFDLSFLPSSFLYPEELSYQRRIFWIKHKTIIPKAILPTFNSNVIEMYLHRIPELSEIYIYLNDDMIIIRPLSIDRIIPSNPRLPIIVPAAKQHWFCSMDYLTSQPRIPFHYVYINTVTLFKAKFNNTCYSWTQASHFPYIQNKTTNQITYKLFRRATMRLSRNKMRRYVPYDKYNGDFNFLFLSNYVDVYNGNIRFTQSFESVTSFQFEVLYYVWRTGRLPMPDSEYINPDFITMQNIDLFSAKQQRSLCEAVLYRLSKINTTRITTVEKKNNRRLLALDTRLNNEYGDKEFSSKEIAPRKLNKASKTSHRASLRYERRKAIKSRNSTSVKDNEVINSSMRKAFSWAKLKSSICAIYV